jgi:hypothetical protein
MWKPSRNVVRELLELGFAVLVFLGLVAVFWIYILITALLAVYRSLVRRS